jgi:predicted ABC-type ATPase
MAERKLAYFNPDVLAHELVKAEKRADDANGLAWRIGYERLRRAVDRGENFAFETTLGGQSIVGELHRAMKLGRDVHVIYVGLSSVDLHVARVKARVARGGHDIPTSKIRERYSKSLTNLVTLIGKASTVHVLDNSNESQDGVPTAKTVLRMQAKKIVEPSLSTLMVTCPEWAKPIAAAAIGAARRRRA